MELLKQQTITVKREIVVKHEQTELIPVVSRYENQQYKVLLIDAETGDVSVTATIQLQPNLVESSIKEVAIKTTGDSNVGILESLIIYGIISNPKRYIYVGLKKIRVPICELLII